MKCRNCGYVIKDKNLICLKCGQEIQIVPDYNPLDDNLDREVRGAIRGARHDIREGRHMTRGGGHATQDVRLDSRYATRPLSTEHPARNTRFDGRYSTRALRPEDLARNTRFDDRNARNEGFDSRYSTRSLRPEDVARNEGFDSRYSTRSLRPEDLARNERFDSKYTTRQLRIEDSYLLRNPHMRQHTSTRILQQEDVERIRREENEKRRARREEQHRRDRQGSRTPRRGEELRGQKRGEQSRNQSGRKGTGREVHGASNHLEIELREQRIREKKLKALLITAVIGVLVVFTIGFSLYQTSYQGIVNRGNRALQAGRMEQAETLFRRAIDRSPHRPEGLVGLSQIYMRNDYVDEAESLLLSALDGQVTNIPLYEAIIDFYLERGQYQSISQLLDGADERVLEALEEFVSPAPIFSLEEGVFHEVQELSITTDVQGVIHYTVDGVEPTRNSQVYEESLLLSEGEHNIRAFLLNERGIPSLTTSKTFIIELPIQTAPAVTPSTGLYHEPTYIVVHVPEGYTAFYTFGGRTPTIASSIYEEPIEMPEGQSIFTAILINNSNGRVTDATIRNFTLEL